MLSYEIPPRQKPTDDNGYFEQLTKAIFQSGFSWAVVRNKWPNFQRAFDGFDVDKVAAYDDRDMDRLLSDQGIVRNGRKIAATIYNARQFQHIREEFGSFHAYLRTMDGQPYAVRRKALVDRFKNLGPTGAYVFLYTVDEEVPSWEERND